MQIKGVMRRVRPSSFIVPATALMAGLFIACGGATEEAADPAGGCGPNGSLHQGPNVDPHCHCDDGFYELDGFCVEETAVSNPGPGQVLSPNRDCGDNGVFNGRFCDCDAGYTQTGLGDAITCEAIPSCTGDNDAHEPNGLPAESTLLTDVDGPLYICPADRDWFIFPVVPGDVVSVQIRFDGDAVDLDLFLFGPSSREVLAASVESSGHSESASFVARANGTAGVLIAPYGTGEGAYELSVDVEAGQVPACASPGGFCSRPSDCCSGICHVSHCH